MRQNEDSYEKEYRNYNTKNSRQSLDTVHTFGNTEWKANPQEFFLIT